MKEELLGALLDALAREMAPVVATDLSSGRQALVLPLGEEGGATATSGDLEVGPELLAAAREAALADASGTVETEGGKRFLRVYNPRLRLVVVGAVHIAQPLAVMATASGFRVVVVDPRRAFATEERFPGVELLRAWPGEAFSELRVDHRTAVVTLTHDPKLDDPALSAALRSDAFYIGALGSRRTHARRLERLASAGFGGEELARIEGPVGLDIGARTPAEIAVSVLAEIVGTLRGAKT